MTCPNPAGSRNDAERSGSETSQRARRSLWWSVGTVGVACIAFGSGWYQVWFGPPYRYVDEQAHVGYVLEVQAGRLPEIDTPIDAPRGGPELQERLSLEQPRRRHVWVANNPPVPYALAAAPSAATRALGLPGGPLVGLRLVNLLAMTAAVVITCRLGLRLSGGDARFGRGRRGHGSEQGMDAHHLKAGILTGGVVAALPHTGFLAGMGMTDGLALLTVVGTIDAVTRPTTWGSRRWWTRVLIWAVAGAAVRPMSAVLCAAAVAFAAAFLLRRRQGSMPASGTVDDEADDASGADRTVPVLVSGVFLAVVSGGWYLRNLVLYGDLTGSERLFAKFDRSPRALAEFSWADLGLVLDTLFLRRLQNELDSDPLGWSAFVLGTIAVGLVALVATAAWERRSVRPAVESPFRVEASGRAAPGLIRLDVFGLLALLSVVNLALVVQHWSGGGGLHPRYALLLSPILVAPLATVVARWASTAGALAMVAAPLVLLWRQVPISSAWVSEHKTAPLTSPLTMSIGPDWLRLGGLVLVTAGTVLVAVALIGSTGKGAWRTWGAEG